MNALTIMLVVWGALTIVLACLMIYRSTLGLHEDTQLFLDEGSAAEEQEQLEIDRKVHRIAPIMKTLGALSGALMLAIIGQFLYNGLH